MRILVPMILKKPGQVSKVDVDLNPGPEARLLPNIPPPPAHPHLSIFISMAASMFTHHNFPVPVRQKLEDPLENLGWQGAVDAPWPCCRCHPGFTLQDVVYLDLREFFRCPGELSFVLVCIRGSLI